MSPTMDKLRQAVSFRSGRRRGQDRVHGRDLDRGRNAWPGSGPGRGPANDHEQAPGRGPGRGRGQPDHDRATALIEDRICTGCGPNPRRGKFHARAGTSASSCSVTAHRASIGTNRSRTIAMTSDGRTMTASDLSGSKNGPRPISMQDSDWTILYSEIGSRSEPGPSHRPIGFQTQNTDEDPVCYCARTRSGIRSRHEEQIEPGRHVPPPTITHATDRPALVLDALKIEDGP